MTVSCWTLEPSQFEHRIEREAAGLLSRRIILVCAVSELRAAPF
jgi:hypothetical protein